MNDVIEMSFLFGSFYKLDAVTIKNQVRMFIEFEANFKIHPGKTPHKNSKIHPEKKPYQNIQEKQTEKGLLFYQISKYFLNCIQRV